MVESPVAVATLFVVAAALARSGQAAPAADDVRQRAGHWAARCPEPDRVLLDAAGVAAFNRRLLALDRSVRDLASLADTLPGADVAALVAGVSQVPETALEHAAGAAVDDADRARWRAALTLDAIPASVAPRFAVVTRRAALRRFPTAERVRRAGGAADIDLFQESAFFPGTSVAVVHATPDGGWSFALGTTYAAWIETGALAFATRDAVLDAAGQGTRIVTAARATAVPVAAGAAGNGGASAAGRAAVTLDMGTALPPGDGPAAVRLPVRAADGTLGFVPARVEPADAVHDGPLPASRRTVLAQAFRFLGEPYGWGHDHDARDCSGFVGEVYRTLGLLLPRNTRDQAASPALDRTVVDPDWPRGRRLAALGRLRAGDLVYAPRHVMMIVGHDDSGPWVIHDTHAGRLAGDPGPPSNGVVVAPLARILADDGGLVVDSVTVLVRVLPPSAAEPP